MTNKINIKPLKYLLCIVFGIILVVWIASEMKGLGLPGTINYIWSYGVGGIFFIVIATLLPYLLVSIWLIRKYKMSKTTLIVLGLFLFSYVLRVLMAEFISGDYYIFLRKWVARYRELSLKECFVEQVGNYAVTYNCFLILFSRLPIFDLYLIKTLSFYFEFAAAIMLVKIIALVRKEEFNPIYLGIALLLIIPILDSSQWAQCDAIYSFFAVAGIYFAMKKQSIWCFVMMGLGLAFKLQIILIYPLVLILLICKNSQGERYLYWKHIWYTPLSFMLASILPMMFGGDMFKAVKAYINQVFVGNLSHALVGNCANIFLQLDWVTRESILYPLLTFVFIGIVAGLLATILIRTYRAKKNSLEAIDILFLAMYLPLMSVYLMPKMLDRFFYMADIFLFATMMSLDGKDRVATRRAYMGLAFGELTTFAFVLGLSFSEIIYYMANIHTGAALLITTILFIRKFKKEEPLIG